MSTPSFHLRGRTTLGWLALLCALTLILAACGNGDDSAIEGQTDTTAVEATPTATVAPTPSPEATQEPAPTDVPEVIAPTATPEPEPAEEADDTAEPESEPAPDVDFAPELAGLTDWRNIDPVSLEDLRGEPVILVFWNSI